MRLLHLTTPLLFLLAATASASPQSGATLARLDGPSSSYGAGGTIAALGDINGDHVPDFVVGGDQYISGNAAVLVYSGADYSIIYQWGGFSNAEAVAAAGDVNADGVMDILVGSIWVNSSSGQAKIFSGANGALLHTFNGANPSDYLGNAVSGAGDVNGDGFDDVLIGAWGESAVLGFSGTASLYSGADGSLIRTYFGQIDSGYFGHAVVGLGDVDGDGVPDQLVGELGNNTFGGNTGAVHLFSGASGTLIRSWTGPHGNSRFGEHIANLGDVDGDGLDDCVVSAMFQQPTGVAHVLSPATGATIYELTGYDPTEVIANSVGAAQDTNGDGVPDIMVGSDRYYTSTGYTGLARVFSGANGRELQRYEATSPNGRLGLAVAGIGDLNGDGFGDLAVGAPAENFNGNNSGSTYIFSGVLEGLHYAVEDFSPGQQAIFRLRGGTPFGQALIGYSLSGGGPTPSAYGDLAMSLPIQILANLTFDASGEAGYLQVLPLSIGGRTIWSQALDLASGTLSNAHPMNTG